MRSRPSITKRRPAGGSRPAASRASKPSGPRTAEPPALPPAAEGRPHGAVAERFRYLLESTGLSREDLVAAVDGAVTARSLFAVLSGARRPSRALAVLVERTFGFRADFLLHGRGAMWREAAAREPDAPGRDAHAASGRDAREADARAPSGLSALEQELVVFARRSVANARALAHALEQARLWERLFARTTRLLQELEACGRSEDADDRGLYPLFAKLVYEECQLIAARFEELESLHHKRRVHALTTAFTERFVEQVPQPHLSTAERGELDAMLAPVMARRRERARVLDAAIGALRATLENVCELGSPKPLLLQQAGQGRARARRAALAALSARIEEALAGARSPLPPAQRARVRRALASLAASLDEPPAFWPLFRQLVEGLVLEVEPEVLHTPAQSVEELVALHRRIVEPLRG